MVAGTAGADSNSAPAMLERYDLKPDPAGWTVVDVWTGQPVVLALRPQTSLSLQDASELTVLLNDQARRGNRLVFQ